MFLRKSTAPAKAAASISGPLGKLFNEIVAGPQQRRLAAQFGDVQVVLDIGNRELLKIISVLPTDFQHADVVDISARDDDALAAQLDQLGRFFAALMDLPGEFTLTSSLAPLRYSTKLQGFSRDELTIATLSNMKAGAAAIAEPVAVVAAPPVAASPALTTGPDLRFYEQLAPRCDAALVMDWTGAILQQAGDTALFDDLGEALVQDMSQWILGTHERLSARQFIVLRGGDASQLGICIMTEPASITTIIFSATSTGRVFQAAAAYAA